MKTKPSPRPTLTAGRFYRLAIFDLCDDSVGLDFVGKLLTDSAVDREYAREAIEEYSAYVARIPGCSYAMGLFPVE